MEESQESLLKEDLKILEDIVKGKTTIEEVDIETKKRLISLCSNRLAELDKKIEQMDKDIIKMEKLLKNM